MGSNYEKQERGEGLISSAMVCCVPSRRNRSATPREVIYSDSSNSAVISQEPQPIEPIMEFEPAPTTRPRTAISVAHSTFSSRRRRDTSLASPRALSLSSIARPWTSHGGAKLTKTRPQIGAPMDFRRVDGPSIAPRRERFRPLELSIYMPTGRLSPLPDFNTDGWESKPVQLLVPKPAVVREWNVLDDEEARVPYPLRSNPISNSMRDLAQRVSSASEGLVSVQNGPGPAVRESDVEMSASAIPYFDDDMPSAIPADDHTPSMARPWTGSHSRPRTPSRSRSPELGHSHSRSLSDMVRPLRSSGSIRRTRPSEVVDEEIRELNTIVEERRASALQRKRESGHSTPTPSALHHVPAIAPSMKLRARSETLSDIGSAFSVPLSGCTAKPEASVISPVYGTPLSSPAPAMTKSSRTSRLRTWFSRSSIRDSSMLNSPPPPQAFYQCEPLHDEAYSLASSPTASTVSTYADYSDDENSPAESYPPTTNTALTTPQSFSPTRELENDVYVPADESPRSRPSVSKRGVRRMPAKRGLSIDTTMTTSSVGTSILGVGAGSSRGNGVPSYEAEPLPTREPVVGMAF